MDVCVCRLTAARLVRVVHAVHVVVALLVLPNTLAVEAGELIGGTPNCRQTFSQKTLNRLVTAAVCGRATDI